MGMMIDGALVKMLGVVIVFGTETGILPGITVGANPGTTVFGVIGTF